MKSVTKILSRVFPFNPNIPKHILENARIRGTTVHEWIEAFNEWKTNGGTKPIIPLEYQIYADYYEEWFDDYEVIPIKSELKLRIEDTEDEEGLVGVIDLLATTKDHELCLVSFKVTYKYDVEYCTLQESAYNELLLQNGVIENKIPATLLHLGKSGYTYLELEDKWDLFKKIKEIDSYLSK